MFEHEREGHGFSRAAGGPSYREAKGGGGWPMSSTRENVAVVNVGSVTTGVPHSFAFFANVWASAQTHFRTRHKGPCLKKKHEREIETLLILAAGPLLQFNTQNKRLTISSGNIRDYEAGTRFFQRYYRKGKRPMG